ncbi:MAG: helix-turn-helix domain-containing protein [Thermomicrobiales bacterium]|nr:helix-turn-helix domain-containing protein [Thermomicrobiales bacterium]
MVRRQNPILITPGERTRLESLASDGATPHLTREHARILLMADQHNPARYYTDAEIADELGVSGRTVARVRARYAQAGLDAALSRRPTRRVYARRLTPDQEHRVVALVGAPPPAGQNRWSLRVLSRCIVEQGIAPSISPETVRTTLQRHGITLGS